MTSNWETTETTVASKFAAIFINHKVELLGGRVSNQADMKISVPNEEKSVYCEIKNLPSVAGLQIVIEDVNGEYKLKSSKNAKPYADALLRLAQKYYERKNETIPLTGEDAFVAFNALEEKYNSNKVEVFIGETGGKLLVSSTSAADLTQRYNVSLTTRIKQSGSRRVPQYRHKTLLAIDENIILGPKNLFVDLNRSSSTKTLETLKNFEDLHVNPLTGEVRVKGKTRNLNVLISFSVKENLEPKYFWNDSQIKDFMVNRFGLLNS